MYKNLLSALCLLLMCLLSIQSVTAQDVGVDYQYKDFRFPNIDRKALEGSLNMFNSGSLNVDHLDGPNTETSRSAFSNNLLLNYSRFRNLEKIQAFENISFDQSFSTNRINSNSSGSPVSSSNGSFEILPQYQSEYRYYYVPNKFWGYTLNIESEYAHTFSRTQNTAQKLNSLVVDVRPAFQFGWGRLEPIDDVFLAKFMVDDLKETGILTQDLTQEELFSLGSLMAFVRNQRIFDFRRLRMYELTEIDRWFTESGLVPDQDFRYFTILNDNWMFAFRNTRFSGNRLSFSIGPSVRWNDNNLGDGNSERARIGLNIGANYQVHNPINQYWQSVSEIAGGLIFNCNTCGEGVDNLLFPFVRAGQTYSWYPNSRTRVHAYGFASYSPNFRTGDVNNITSHSVASGLSFSADYFLSFQLRVRAELGYVFRFTDVNSDEVTGIDFTQSSMGFQSNITFLYTFF